MKKRNLVLSLVASSILATSVIAADSVGEFVVTAKSNNEMQDIAANITIVTSQEIESMNAASLKDVLESVSGISISQNSSSISGRQSISIRGSNADQVLILVDGKVVSGTDAQIGHSDFQYNWVPMTLIDRIEVIKGPMSSIYGSQAIGGVINIITKKSDEKFFGSLDIQKGVSSEDKGGDSTDMAFTLGGKITESLNASVSIEKKDLEVASEEETPSTTKIEGKEIQNNVLKAEYLISDTQSLDLFVSKGTEDRLKVDDGKYYEIEKRIESLGYSLDLDDMTLDLQYSTTESDNDYYLTTTSTTPYYRHALTDETIRIDSTISSIKNNFIAFGIDKKTTGYSKDYTSSNTNDFKAEIDTSAVYIQDEIEFGDKVILTAGARYDNHEKFGGEISPKIGIVYKPTTEQRLKFGYGEGFKAPTVTQNSSSYTFVGYRSFVGNDNLKPETSYTVDLGYEIYMKDSVFKATVFNTSVSDLVTTETQTSGTYSGYRMYVNKEKAKMEGFDLEYNTEFGNASSIDLSFGHLKTKDQDGDRLSYKPRRKGSARLATLLPLGISTNIRANYTGEQTDGSKDIGGYTLYGVQFSKEVMKGLKARLGSENLTNKDLNGEPFENKARLVYLGVNYSF